MGLKNQLLRAFRAENNFKVAPLKFRQKGSRLFVFRFSISSIRPLFRFQKISERKRKSKSRRDMKRFLLVVVFVAITFAVSVAAFSAVESGILSRIYLLGVVLPLLWYLLKAFIEFLNQPQNSDNLKFDKTFAALIVVFIFAALFCFCFVIKFKKPNKSHRNQNFSKPIKNLRNLSFQKSKFFKRGKGK